MKWYGFHAFMDSLQLPVLPEVAAFPPAYHDDPVFPEEL